VHLSSCCGVVGVVWFFLSKVVQVFGLSLGVIQSVWVSWGLFQVGCRVSRPDITYHGLFATLYQLINVSYV
jgi:multisubunit Na+/H+ antiporter MnhE subunit